MQLPVHAELVGDGQEAGPQRSPVRRCAAQHLHLDPHEEAVGGNVGELLAVQDVAARAVQVGGHRVHDARPVRAGQGEHELPDHARPAGQPPTACTPPSTCTISPVVAGNQSDSRATHACAAGPGSAEVPAERRPAGPHVLEAAESRDALGRHGAQRPGRDQVDPDSVRPQVAGQIPGARLQPGLGHAHPVVGRPGPGRVEVQADDRASAAHQRLGRHGQGLERVGGHLDRGWPRPATRWPGSCRPARPAVRCRCCAPRRAAGRRGARPPARASEASWSGSVTSSSITGGGSGSRLAIRCTRLSRPKPVSTSVAPSCWAMRAT